MQEYWARRVAATNVKAFKAPEGPLCLLPGKSGNLIEDIDQHGVCGIYIMTRGKGFLCLASQEVLDESKGKEFKDDRSKEVLTSHGKTFELLQRYLSPEYKCDPGKKGFAMVDCCYGFYLKEGM